MMQTSFVTKWQQRPALGQTTRAVLLQPCPATPPCFHYSKQCRCPNNCCDKCSCQCISGNTGTMVMTLLIRLPCTAYGMLIETGITIGEGDVTLGFCSKSTCLAPHCMLGINQIQLITMIDDANTYGTPASSQSSVTVSQQVEIALPERYNHKCQWLHWCPG